MVTNNLFYLVLVYMICKHSSIKLKRITTTYHLNSLARINNNYYYNNNNNNNNMMMMVSQQNLNHYDQKMKESLEIKKNKYSIGGKKKD